jgi:hypothetical protein
MKLILTDEEIEKIVYDCFVDGGLIEIGHSDIEIMYKQKEYDAAAMRLKTEAAERKELDVVCYEDVLMALWKDGKLYFRDHNEEKTIPFTVDTVKEKLTSVLASENVNEQAITEALEILTENGSPDAWTGFNMLQFMLFGELVYG